MNKFVFSLAIAAMGGMMHAQEMGAAATTAVAVAATDGKTSVAVAATQTAKDGGQEIINAAVEKAPVMAAIDAKAEPAESAEELVEKKLAAAGLTPGYDRKRQAIVQVGVGSIKVENPITDKNFMLAREGMALYAYNNAKADVIRSINAEFSAIDRVMTIAEFGEDETATKFAAKKGELEGKRDQLATLLEEVKALNTEEAVAMRTAAIGGRFGSLMDAVIKKIDSTYDPKAIDANFANLSAERKAKIESLRAECDKLLSEYKQLEAEANALKKDPALETANDVKILSEMPLLGSSVLTQAESWDPDEKIFTVAMAIVWSPNLQEQAVKMITDDFKPMEKKGKYSLREWIDAQEFSHMVGPRRFTDKDGMNLFIGLSAMDLNMPVVKQNAAKKLADAMAMKGVAFSLSGDLATYREASQNLKVYEDDTKGAAAKLKDTVNSQVSLNLNGCMKLVGKTVVHPLLNRKIYVSAYYIDPALAGEAKGYMTKLFTDAGIARIITKQKQAYTRGAQEMLARIDARPVAPVHLSEPKIVPPPPPMPKLIKPVANMSKQEKAAAKQVMEDHKAKLEAQQKVIDARQQQIEAEKRAAQERAKKEQIAREQQLLEARRRQIEEQKTAVQAILNKLYKAVDNELDTNF